MTPARVSSVLQPLSAGFHACSRVCFLLVVSTEMTFVSVLTPLKGGHASVCLAAYIHCQCVHFHIWLTGAVVYITCFIHDILTSTQLTQPDRWMCPLCWGGNTPFASSINTVFELTHEEQLRLWKLRLPPQFPCFSTAFGCGSKPLKIARFNPVTEHVSVPHKPRFYCEKRCFWQSVVGFQNDEKCISPWCDLHRKEWTEEHF